MSIDNLDTVPYAVPMQDTYRSKLNVMDRISWCRSIDGERVFGHIRSIRHGTILAVTDHGVYMTLRRRDVTKECG